MHQNQKKPRAEKDHADTTCLNWPKFGQNDHPIFINQEIMSEGRQMSCFWAKFKKNEENAKIVVFKI